MTGLAAYVVVQRGDFSLNATVHVRPGEVVAVVGPNGSGKTTLVQALAGLVPVTAGELLLDGAPAGDVRTRRVGLVDQDGLLFPHLTVLDNVAFGPRSRGTGRAKARDVARQWLDRMELLSYADRRPPGLSGGERQRVALARALASGPRLVLLDEPLAAVDVPARAELRHELGRHLRAFGRPAVVVTHDLLDVLALADRIVVLDNGMVVETGLVADVVDRPRSEFMARLADVNLLSGIGDGECIHAEDGRAVVGTRVVTGPAMAVFRPEAVAVFAERPEGSPRNVWPARIARVEPRGGTVRLVTEGRPALRADITAAGASALGARPGLDVWLAVKATQVDIYA